MEIVASIDFEQYKAALAALKAPAIGYPANTRRHYKSIAISALIAISFLLADYVHGIRDNAALAFIAFFLVYGACLALQRWSRRRYDACLKKIYTAQEKQLCGQQMSITREGISGSSADLTYTYQYQWASFVRLIDLPDGLLLLPNVVSFVRIPKAPLSSDDLHQIKAWWTSYTASSS